MMRLSVPSSARCSSIRQKASMHKFMGLHHHNLLATTPNHSSSPASAQIVRSSSGPLMPRSSSYGMLTCAVRGGMGPNSIVTVRCLPVEDDGLLQLSGTDAGDAIMGDVDMKPRPGMGKQQGQEGRAQTAGDANIAHALKASIPKGPLAKNAAMCEPMPGDPPPGNLSDPELAAMREGRHGSTNAKANISTAGVTTASSETEPDATRWLEAAAAANEGKGQQTAGGGSAAMQAGGVEAGRGGSNAPANDPELIKQVVQEETLHGQE